MRSVYLSFALSSIACATSIDPSLDNRACTADGECVAGYVCSENQICVKPEGSSAEPQTAADAGPESDANTSPDAGGVNTGTAPPPDCDKGMVCGTSCVDVQQNLEHCGACGRRCAGTDHGKAICSSGKCELACDDGYTRCGDRCFHLHTDPSHCGDCNFSCPSESNSTVACVGGKCQTTCHPGAEKCGDECVRLDNDFRHCGACGRACEADQECANRACVKECPAGTRECARSCVDLNSDVQHCGACDQACAAPPGASPACRDKVCTFDCPEGRTRCGDACVDTQTDLANCGTCGQVCKGTSAWNHPVCEAGGCDTRCNAGFVACQGQCISLALISNNRSLAACVVWDGLQDVQMCTSMGESTTYCGSECVDTSRDERHCGGCGKACAEGQTCDTAACK